MDKTERRKNITEAEVEAALMKLGEDTGIDVIRGEIKGGSDSTISGFRKKVKERWSLAKAVTDGLSPIFVQAALTEVGTHIGRVRQDMQLVIDSTGKQLDETIELLAEKERRLEVTEAELAATREESAMREKDLQVQLGVEQVRMGELENRCRQLEQDQIESGRRHQAQRAELVAADLKFRTASESVVKLERRLDEKRAELKEINTVRSDLERRLAVAESLADDAGQLRRQLDELRAALSATEQRAAVAESKLAERRKAPAARATKKKAA